jgi:rubrerythrin
MEETMSFFRDVTDSFLKYGEIFLNKTEEYTKVAKLMIEIKQTESDSEKCHARLGRIVSDEVLKGAVSLDLTLNEIREEVDRIMKNNEKISFRKKEIEEARQKNSSDDERSDGGPSSRRP